MTALICLYRDFRMKTIPNNYNLKDGKCQAKGETSLCSPE